MGSDRLNGSELDAAVIHDVKNRLAILTDELNKLNELALPPQAHGHAASATRQTRHITRKLVEYLTLRRAADPGGLRAETREEVPALLLDEILADARTLAGERLQVDLAPNVPPEFWFFDRYLVLLALDSALYNALKFARSRVVLGARAEPCGLCFFVSDDGPGLQGQPASGTSTGLGLRVCEAVAQAHRNKGVHGRIELRNREDGPGAVFELHLP